MSATAFQKRLQEIRDEVIESDDDDEVEATNESQQMKVDDFVEATNESQQIKVYDYESQQVEGIEKKVSPKKNKRRRLLINHSSKAATELDSCSNAGEA